MLGQQEEKEPYAIYYISKNLTGPELNYTITEKELLVVVHAINKFRHYITWYQVYVHTNHDAIKDLMNKTNASGIIIRWLLLLQQLDITIMDKPGRHNVVAYFPSRLEHTIEK